MTNVVSSFMPASPLAAPMGLISGLRSGKATDRAAQHQVSGNEAAQRELQPYMDTGKQANTLIQNKLASGELGGNFTPGDLTKEPGYLFRLAEGTKALERKQAGPGGGGYFSGQALKEAQQYGQGLADQTYNDAYNRWLQHQQNTYNILSGQQGQGYGAAKDYGGYSAAIGDILANRTIAKENQRMKMTSDVLGGLNIK